MESKVNLNFNRSSDELSSKVLFPLAVETFEEYATQDGDRISREATAEHTVTDTHTESDSHTFTLTVTSVDMENEWLVNKSFSFSTMHDHSSKETQACEANRDSKAAECYQDILGNAEELPQISTQFVIDRLPSNFSCFSCLPENMKISYYCKAFSCPLGYAILKQEQFHKNLSRYFDKTAKKCIGMKLTAVLNQNIEQNALQFIRISKKHIPLNNETFVLKGDDSQQKVYYYNRTLKDEPHNIALWKEFVSFQDSLLKKKKDFVHSSGNLIKICNEKKLAIIAQALEANPSSAELKLLQITILREETSDFSLLEKEWKELLFGHPEDIFSWRQYLKFQQTELSVFSVQHVTEAYQLCIKTLGNALESTRKITTEEELIDIFYQYCKFLLQTGYKEKAVASAQALVEFNLFRPPCFNLMSAQQSLTAFSRFWSSGVPRFGEPNAKGWSCWINDSGSPRNGSFESFCENQNENVDNTEGKMSLAETWLKLERRREQTHLLPKRHLEDEENSDDFDSLVLADDVTPVMFKVHQSTSCLKLVCRMISLLCCEKIGDIEAEVNQLNLSTLNQILPASDFSLLQMDFCWTSITEFTTFIEEILCQSSNYFTGYQHSFFAAQLLHFQVKKYGLHLSLSKEQSKFVVKFGKKLLKEMQNRNDLVLWEVYIRMIWALGEKKDALTMLRTILSMSSSYINTDNYYSVAGLCALYCTLCDITLGIFPLDIIAQSENRIETPDSECMKRVMCWIVCFAEKGDFVKQTDTIVSPTIIVRTKNYFSKAIEDMLILQTDQNRPDLRLCLLQHIRCLALFDLCACGILKLMQTFDSVFELCDVALQKAESAEAKRALKTVQKDICLNSIRMLKYSWLSHMIFFGQFRSWMTKCISQFPNDPDLLYQWLIVGSQNNLMPKPQIVPASGDEEFIYPILFEVLTELKRHRSLLTDESLGNTQGASQKVRAVFERGLQQTAMKHCPLLWRLYLFFEKQYGTLERAQGILYRALQSCPWAKVLYLDGVELFGDKLLQELMDLLSEKELRLHVLLEEVKLITGLS